MNFTPDCLVDCSILDDNRRAADQSDETLLENSKKMKTEMIYPISVYMGDDSSGSLCKASNPVIISSESTNNNSLSSTFSLEIIQDQLDIEPSFLTKVPLAESVIENDLTVYPDLTFINDNIACDKQIDLNNIQLYLECSDDSESIASSSILDSNSNVSMLTGTSFLKSDIRFKVSFPVFPEESGKGCRCCICKIQFELEKVLRYHVITEHKEIHMCPGCSYNTKSRKYFENHIQTKHKGLIATELQSQKSTADKEDCEPNNCTTHICKGPSALYIDKTKNTQLPVERLSYDGQVPLGHTQEGADTIPDRHIDNPEDDKVSCISKDENGECECSNVTDDISSKKGFPLQQVKCLEKFTCCVCGFVTKSLKLLKMHKSAMHSSSRPVYHCSECLYECKQKRSFLAHSDLHNNSFKFKCDVCSKQFVSKSIYTRHKKTHNIDRQHVCDFENCEKAFKTKGALSDHKRKVHSTNNFTRETEKPSSVNAACVVDVNSSKYSTMESCTRKISPCNRKNDNNELSIDCVSLNDECLDETNMTKTREKSTWTGMDGTDSNFQHSSRANGVCKTARTRHITLGHNSSLHKDHSQKDHGSSLHKKTKSFCCPYKNCQKAFRDNFNLKNHLCTHEGVKSLSCGLCDYTCVQQSSLNHHMKHKH